MRILHVITSVDPADGGTVEAVLRQCQALADCHCEVVSLDSPDAPFVAGFPVPLHTLGTRPFARRGRSRLARFGYTPRLVPWLKRHARAYDIVVVNGLWNYASMGSSFILPRLGVPYVVFPHGMMDPWFRRAYPLKHWAKQIFWTLFDGRLMQHASAALFICAEEMKLARGQFLGHPYREHIARFGSADAIGDAVEQIAAFKAAVPELAGRPYFLFLGRLHPKKGCDMLIRAWAEAQVAHYDLVMAGPDQVGWMEDLRSLADTLGIGDRVHWPGLLTGPAKWGAFAAAEAFVLPTHQDSLGVAIGEALAYGTPVLITDKVNIWQEVAAGHGGFVRSDDQAGIGSLLSAYLELDGPARSAMRAAARLCFTEYFDAAKAARETVEIYRQLAQIGA